MTPSPNADSGRVISDHDADEWLGYVKNLWAEVGDGKVSGEAEVLRLWELVGAAEAMMASANGRSEP